MYLIKIINKEYCYLEYKQEYEPYLLNFHLINKNYFDSLFGINLDFYLGSFFRNKYDLTLSRTLLKYIKKLREKIF